MPLQHVPDVDIIIICCTSWYLVEHTVKGMCIIVTTTAEYLFSKMRLREVKLGDYELVFIRCCKFSWYMAKMSEIGFISFDRLFCRSCCHMGNVCI